VVEYCNAVRITGEDIIVKDTKTPAVVNFVFRKHDSQDPMMPSTFVWRFKLIP